MRRTLILVTALALSLSSTAYELNAKGLKEGTAGNFDEASSNFSKAIEAAKDPMAYISRGIFGLASILPG